jgi:hypothetical protein
MNEPRRSDRNRTQTQFLGETEALVHRTTESSQAARVAREAAVASALDHLRGLQQLGEGREGRVWVGTDTPHLHLLYLVQHWPGGARQRQPQRRSRSPQRSGRA